MRFFHRAGCNFPLSATQRRSETIKSSASAGCFPLYLCSCVSALCLERLLSILPSEDVSTPGEALLYCVGALKFLSGNGATVPLLLDGSCVAASQKLIRKLCAAEDQPATMTGLILVQVWGKRGGLFHFHVLNYYLPFLCVSKIRIWMQKSHPLRWYLDKEMSVCGCVSARE